MLSCETWAEAVAKVPETCPAPAGSGLLPAQIRAMANLANLANIQISSPKHDLEKGSDIGFGQWTFFLHLPLPVTQGASVGLEPVQDLDENRPGVKSRVRCLAPSADSVCLALMQQNRTKPMSAGPK